VNKTLQSNQQGYWKSASTFGCHGRQRANSLSLSRKKGSRSPGARPCQPVPGDALATKQRAQVVWDCSAPRFWALVWGCSVVQLEQEQHIFSREVQILLTQEAAEQTIRFRAIKTRLLSKKWWLDTNSF